jgi:hypothetical protein
MKWKSVLLLFRATISDTKEHNVERHSEVNHKNSDTKFHSNFRVPIAVAARFKT